MNQHGSGAACDARERRTIRQATAGAMVETTADPTATTVDVAGSHTLTAVTASSHALRLRLLGTAQQRRVHRLTQVGAEPMSTFESPISHPIPLTLADVRGLCRLGFDASLGLTDLVEQMHRTIGDRAAPLGRPRPARTRGVTGAVYGTVRAATRGLSRGIDSSLRLLEPRRRSTPTSPAREAALAAINGVWGDYLEASGNPLAIPMSLRVNAQTIDLSSTGLKAAELAPSGRIALLVHGLAMNDLQWQRDGHDHGSMLERELGYTVIRAHYNSGLHVSENGERLAQLIEEMLAAWPVAVQELAIVGHSMGGLVARSACQCAELRSLGWRQRLTRLICLGTPHHGAMLERGGHLVDSVLELSPYVAPFTRLGKARSAGITDLRFGNLQRSDWTGRPAHAQRRDDRIPVPLPAGVEVYFVAATTAERPQGLRHALIGDGLVTLASAWGEHRDKQRALPLPASHKALITRANHWDLLSRLEAAHALKRWLA
jgi:pimeloyl-ACP methyl ester carboxylesterase